jgi:hypothetical protein
MTVAEAEIMPGGPEAGLTEHPGSGSYIGDRTAESAQTPMDAVAIEQGRRTEAERRVCSQPGCPGDGRYQPPGRGHLPGCLHDAVTWTWEQVSRPGPPS